jgi:hypothetical protein
LLRFARNDGQGIGSLVSACRLNAELDGARPAGGPAVRRLDDPNRLRQPPASLNGVEGTEPIGQTWRGRTLSSLRSCGLRGAGNRPCRSPVAFPRAARDEQFVMFANASIQNTTTLQGLPLGAGFDDFATCVAASSFPHGWIPGLAVRSRGDDACWLGASRCSSCFAASPTRPTSTRAARGKGHIAPAGVGS